MRSDSAHESGGRATPGPRPRSGPLPRIAVCVPAAGAGIRMGAPKALLPIEGTTFLDRLLGSMQEAGIAPRYVVVRAADDGPAMRAACARREARLVVNADPDRGMLSSIHACLDEIAREEAAAAGEPGSRVPPAIVTEGVGPSLPGPIEALFIAPVDCPRVRAETIARLAAAFAATRAPIVVPRFGERRGHPALFARALFAELRAAPLDVGARAVVRAHVTDLCEVPVDDSAVLEDFDHPA